MNFKTIFNDIKNNTSHSLDYLLSDNLDESLSKNGLKIRKVISPLLRKIYRGQSNYEYVLDGREEFSNNSTGNIFVVNHRQSDDMVFSALTAGCSGYFVFGNKILALESAANGYGLWLYGMILLDRDNKKSRRSCYEKMKYIINHGGNIIIFPEGYWNLNDNGRADARHNSDDHNSENWLVQDLNLGAIRLAQETGCAIVPTILHYDEVTKKTCYGKRGAQIFVGKDDDLIAKKDEVLQSMTSIYWSLMENYSCYKRSELITRKSLKEQWEDLKERLVRDCDIPKVGYKLDLDNEKLIGKAPVKKNITINEEAFDHLNDVNYNENNAYLLSRKLSGKRI